jgi:hypothetical protein
MVRLTTIKGPLTNQMRSMHSINQSNLKYACIFAILYSYSTIYTMFPVFSLVLDEDVTADVALRFPELYKDLSKVKQLA